MVVLVLSQSLQMWISSTTLWDPWRQICKTLCHDFSLHSLHDCNPRFYPPTVFGNRWQTHQIRGKLALTPASDDSCVWTFQRSDPRACKRLTGAWKMSSRRGNRSCRERVTEPCNVLQPVRAETPLPSSAGAVWTKSYYVSVFLDGAQ